MLETLFFRGNFFNKHGYIDIYMVDARHSFDLFSDDQYQKSV